MKKQFFAIAAFSFATLSHASAVFMFADSGPNVVGTLSGSLTLPAPANTSIYGSTGADAIQPFNGDVSIGSPANTPLYLYNVTGPASFGTGTTSADSYSGLSIALYGTLGDLFIPVSYVSNSALNASLTFDNTNIAALGLTPGNYVYTLSNSQTFTVEVPSASTGNSVPEPASLALVGVALAGLGIARKRSVDNQK